MHNEEYKDKMLWDIWLHKVFDKSFADFTNGLEGNQQEKLSDHAAYEAELARLEKEVPVCCYCGRPVMDDYYYEINDEVYCADCLDRHFKKEVVVE